MLVRSKIDKINIPQDRGVAGDDDKLSLAVTKGLQSLLVSENVLSGLGDHCQAGVDVFSILLLKSYIKITYLTFKFWIERR